MTQNQLPGSFHITPDDTESHIPPENAGREFIQSVVQDVAQFQNASLSDRIARLEAERDNANARLNTLAGQAPPNVTTTPPSQRTRPRFPEVETYSHDRPAEFPVFQHKLRAKLEVDKAAIGDSESDLVDYAFSRLTGKAATMVLPWVDKNRAHHTEYTTARFFGLMEERFEDRAQSEKALHRLLTMSQGSRSLDEYVREIETLVMQAGGWGWDDRAKIGYMENGLRQEMREGMAFSAPANESFVNYCERARRAADGLSRARQGRRLPHQVRTSGPRNGSGWFAPSHTTNNSHTGVEPMELDSIQRTGRRAKWVDDTEVTRRRAAGECLRCSAKGHMVSSCPFAKARRPATILNRIMIDANEIPDAVLEEDDDGSEAKPEN